MPAHYSNTGGERLTLASADQHNRNAMTARDEPRPVRNDVRPLPARDAGLEPRIKLWLEKDGALVLSDYRVQLLRHVCAWRSVLLTGSSNNGPGPRLKAVRYFVIWCHQN